MSICWFPREVGSVCDKCTEGRVLLQYASNSSSPRPCAPSGHWSPREAEGTVQYCIVYLMVVRFHSVRRCHCEGDRWFASWAVLWNIQWLKCALTDAYYNKAINIVSFYILHSLLNLSLTFVSCLQGSDLTQSKFKTKSKSFTFHPQCAL